jgi:hypothetical protein
MCACAGSSTERTRSLTSCVPPEQSGPQEHDFFRYFAGQVQMDRAPGRIGFMSTQRREIRWRHTSCTRYTGRSGKLIPGPIAQRSCAITSGGTAPPGFPAWLATNSLQSDYRIVQLVLQDLRHGSPPFGADPGAATGTPATHRSSPPQIPSFSGYARLHPTLPRVPAGRRRWAERYDGKGNLHLQHAA